MRERTKSDAGEAVTRALIKVLRVMREQCVDEADLFDDLGADSLDAVEILMWIEDELGVDVADDAVAGLRTVGDLHRVVREAANG